MVGCLGVDTTTKTMPALLAKVKGLRAEGIAAFLYSGGYNVPPVTLTGSVRSDMMLVEEVIGAGETAVADLRSLQPRSESWWCVALRKAVRARGVCYLLCNVWYVEGGKYREARMGTGVAIVLSIGGGSGSWGKIGQSADHAAANRFGRPVQNG